MESNRLRDWTVTIAFFLFLATPLAVQVSAPAAKISHVEKRLMAEAPTMPATLADWVALPNRIDIYLFDHFGLRRSMAGTFSRLKLSLGESSNDRVLVGRDGWLFFADDKAVEQYRGLDVFSAAELEAWVATLQAVARATRRRGARFVFVVAPNKHTIYPEYLPRWARQVVGITRFDQLYGRLAEMSDIGHVDLRPHFAAAKNDRQLYFPLDTHWNHFTAFVAYRAIMGAAGDPGIAAATLGLSDLRPVSMLSEGDLAGLIGLEDRLVAPMTSFEVASPPHHVNRRRIVHYPAGEDYNVIHVADSGRLDRPTILMIGDSFSGYARFFFEASADKYVWTHHRHGAFDLGLVDEYTPDLVVFEIAERFLLYPLARPGGLEEDFAAGSILGH